MATIGSKKQEEKLNEFAKIAKNAFPEVNELTIKGAFRYGAKAAVEKSQFSSWTEISKQSEGERRKFFDTLLEEARPHLESAIDRKNVEYLIKQIKLANDKYLKS